MVSFQCIYCIIVDYDSGLYAVVCLIIFDCVIFILPTFVYPY